MGCSIFFNISGILTALAVLLLFSGCPEAMAMWGVIIITFIYALIKELF